MRLTTKVAVTTIASALALTLTSCSGAGPNAATRMITRVTDGAEAVVKDETSDLRVSNLLLVATEDGSAVLVGHIVNRAGATDKILGITVGQSQAVLSGQLELLTNKPVHFEGDSANAKAVFPGVNAQAGTTVDLTIGFARAGLVTVRTIIRDKRDIYSNVISGAKLSTPATK
jgi:hypothetical protein